MGDVVFVDFCIIECVNFEVDEVVLIGEFVFVWKDFLLIFGVGYDSDCEDNDIGFGDCFNVVFSFMIIIKGCGRVIVFVIGMYIEIGVIVVVFWD